MSDSLFPEIPAPDAQPLEVERGTAPPTDRPAKVMIPAAMRERLRRGPLAGESLTDTVLRYLSTALDEWEPK